ncbi:MAG: PIN domain-containing protein, partial [Haloarculaceae archaeon]
GAVRVILDTSFLIDLFDGREGAFEKGIELSETKTVQRVPSPVVMELSYGTEFGDEEERRNVRNALRMYPVVEQDETTADRAGQLLARADQKADGESGIDKVDPMVAAVSDVYDEPVLTDNVGDFTALGVEVETY